MSLICTSCGVEITAKDRFVKFMCPKCGKVEIVRCGKCKSLVNPYKCPNCKFEGP